MVTSGPFRAFEGMCQIIRDPIMLVATETRAPYTRSRILSVNAAAEALLQFSTARLYNQSLHQLLLDDEDPLNTSWQNYNFDLEQPWQGKLNLRTKNSKQVAADASVTRIGHEHGENYYVVRFTPQAQMQPSPTISSPGTPGQSNKNNINELPDWLRQLSQNNAPLQPAGSPLPKTDTDAPAFVTQTPFSPSFSLDSLGMLPSWTTQTSPVEPEPVAEAETEPTAPASVEFLAATINLSPTDRLLSRVLGAAPAAIFRIGIKDGDFIFLDANQKHQEISGYGSTDIRGQAVRAVLPADKARELEQHYRQGFAADTSYTYEVEMDTPIGKRWFQSTIAPIRNEDNQTQELVGVSIDITDRMQTADTLAEKIDQQAAIAELGQLALTQLDLDTMLGKATEIIATAMRVPYSKIQEYSSNEQVLRLRAGTGWNPGLVGLHTASIWDNTQAANTLKSLNPIIVENFDIEKRYVASDLLKSHGIKSGAAVVISGLSGPYGILSVHSEQPSTFNEGQIYFLQAAADTLANAIKNNLSEQALRESERLVSSILESAQIGIGVSDESGRFVRVNPAFCKIFGYEARDILGREFTILLPFSEHQQARQVYSEFMKTGIEASGEGTCLRSDGRPVDVHITAGRLQRADGSMLRVTTVEDITKRKITENSLKLFQLAAINSHDGVIITEPGPIENPGPKIIFANAAASDITGFAPHEILGATLRVFQGPQSDPEKARELQSAMRSRQPADVEMILQRKNSGMYWAEIAIAPVTDMQGRLMNWLMTFRDVTERKENEKLLTIAKDQAVTASQAKSDFLAGISHEIRTPLNAIIGFADVLRREIFGALGHERYRTYAQDIHDSGRHLLQLINNTLDLSKIESGVLELHESEVPIDAVIRSSVALLRDNAQNAKLEIHTDIADGLPLLWADETKVKQVLLNMLSNAIKYTLPGGKITVRAALTDRGLALGVEDTGIGIPKAELPKVMQKYMQASNEQNKHQTGTGLGIPVIKSLIEIHQGWLELSSTEGVGTAITAIFPKERLRASPSRSFPKPKLAS